MLYEYDLLIDPEQPVFPNSKEPRPDDITTLLTAFELEILTTYLTVTVCPKALNEQRVKVLEALMGNPKFLNGFDSSLLNSCSISSSAAFFCLLSLGVNP